MTLLPPPSVEYFILLYKNKTVTKVYYGELSSYLFPLLNFKIAHNCLFVLTKDIEPSRFLINVY